VNTRIVVLLLSVTGMSFSPLASAQSENGSHPWFTSKFQLNGGAYFTNQGYEIGAGVSLPDDDIDFDGELGVEDSQTSFAGGFRWNFGEKWSFRMQNIFFDVDGSAVLEEDLSFDDIVFKAGSAVSAGVENEIYRAFLGRKFSEGPNYEFGAGFGLHYMTVEASISGEVIAGDGTSSGIRRASVDADLPLPNIGFWYWYSPSPRWLLTSRLDWLSASIGDYSGSLWNVAVGAQFQISDHVGVATEFAYFALRGDVDTSNWHGSLESSSSGPLVQLNVNW
jgi:hypothetical protein